MRKFWFALSLLLTVLLCTGLAEEEDVLRRVQDVLSAGNLAEDALQPVDPRARRIRLEDPDGKWDGCAAYIVGRDMADLVVTLPEDVDPETVRFFRASGGDAETVSADGGVLSCAVESLETTGRSFTFLYMTAGADQSCRGACLLFRDEPNADAFASEILSGSWSYVDAAYTIRCVDQNGGPVAGVICQVCDETTCQVFVTDEEGVCEFVLAPYPWEIHVLKAPEGYEVDAGTVTAPEAGGEVILALKQAD